VSRPVLHTFVDGELWTRTAAPDDIAPRAWLLGVVAVQVGVEEGLPVAQVRAHVTGGAAPEVRRLASPSLVQVTLTEDDVQHIDTWRFDAHMPRGAAAQVLAARDGRPAGAATLPDALVLAQPAPRAFGHVYCRWLRDGGIEPGFDLTDFHSQPPGQKFERLFNFPITVGEVLSYAYVAR
jgi:hypothetical protein